MIDSPYGISMVPGLLTFYALFTAISVDPSREAAAPVVKVRKHPSNASRVLLPDGRYMAYHEQGVLADAARFSLVAPHSFLSSRLAGKYKSEFLGYNLYEEHN